ncbi:YfcC family protein [uncultured Clostridium sp.]|uniref:YfcC family protein n=1 Tax=uncultured Clostridium sp. TaxID=59620 RepID=UPI0025CF6315|nr:TIGR00366 family protein [uncultured Clostridium sp.]
MAENEKKKKFQLPHIYLLLLIIIFACAIATWILPAGEFEHTINDAGIEVVVPGTFHIVESTPVGPFAALKSLYGGMLNGAGVIFFVFISYASIGLIIQTGAFNGLVAFLLRVLKGNMRAIIIPIFITVIGAASSTIGIFEETLPFIPIFVGIAIAMGYDALVGTAIVALGAGLGYSGAFMNPFTVGMAQSIAGLPQMSGTGYRIFCHAMMIAVASIYVVRYALKIQKDPTQSLVYGDDFSHMTMDTSDLENHPFGIREKLVLFTLVAGIAVIVWGSKTQGWYFEELNVIFLLMGVISAIIMGWKPNDIADKIAHGFTDIAMACLMIGLARSILVVLQSGHIIDTVVYGASIPLSYLPSWLSSIAMLLVQTVLNFLIPSGSGQAVTSMPIMAPLSDLIGVSRQTAVLAFQFGDGISNILWPTGFAPILCGIAGLKLDKWWKWFVPLFLLILLTQAVLMALSVVVWA